MIMSQKTRTSHKLKGYRLLVAKAYFDKGWSTSAYLKYVVAVGAIKLPSLKMGILLGLGYGIFCYLLGRWWYNYRLIDTENEIQNKFNPFVGEVREKFGLPNNRNI